MCTDDQHTQKIALLESIDRSLSLHRTQPYIDDTISISTAQPFVVDRKSRKHLYIWSATSFTATVEDVGTLTVPSNIWVACGFAQGMRMVPSISVTVLARATDEPIRTALNSALGTRTGTYSMPVTIAYDQAPIPSYGNFLEFGNLSAAALNADLLPSTDVSAYRQIALQLSGTWSGTVSPQCSNDNVNWISFSVYNALNSVLPDSTNLTANGILFAPLGFRYLRLRVTTYTSGTINGTVELYASPTGPLNEIVTAYQRGSWNISATFGAAGTNDFHLISAATTNATVIKASAAQVYGWSIYNAAATARYVKLYNKVLAPTVGTDTPLRTIGIPALSVVNYISTVGIPCSLGLGVATTTGIADSDTAAVTLNDLAIEIDWK